MNRRYYKIRYRGSFSWIFLKIVAFLERYSVPLQQARITDPLRLRLGVSMVHRSLILVQRTMIHQCVARNAGVFQWTSFARFRPWRVEGRSRYSPRSPRRANQMKLESILQEMRKNLLAMFPLYSIKITVDARQCLLPKLNCKWQKVTECRWWCVWWKLTVEVEIFGIWRQNYLHLHLLMLSQMFTFYCGGPLWWQFHENIFN